LSLICLLFFSSRRRHTRFSRDWSSDVCSSDLRHSPTLLPCPHEVVRSRDSRRSSEGCFGFPSRVSGQQLGPQAQRQQMRVNEPQIGRASCREGGKMSVGG